MTSFQITHDESAFLDLVEEHTYLAQNASLKTADNYISGLLGIAERIAQFPRIGTKETWIARRLKANPEEVRSFRFRNHRCIYILRGENEIYILGYIHAKREKRKALRERLSRLRDQS